MVTIYPLLKNEEAAPATAGSQHEEPKTDACLPSLNSSSSPTNQEDREQPAPSRLADQVLPLIRNKNKKYISKS